MDWFKMHAATIVKVAAMVLTVGGGSLAFFTDLKTDVAVLQEGMRRMEQNSVDTEQKIDILLRAYTRDDAPGR